MFRRASIIGAILVSACSDLCTNEELARALSPDQRHAAVMYLRDCGATTAGSIQISILKTNGRPSGIGNVLIADSNKGAVYHTGWSGPLADARWISSDHLLIRYAAGSRIFKQADRIGAIKVTYERVELYPAS